MKRLADATHIADRTQRLKEESSCRQQESELELLFAERKYLVLRSKREAVEAELGMPSELNSGPAAPVVRPGTSGTMGTTSTPGGRVPSSPIHAPASESAVRLSAVQLDDRTKSPSELSAAPHRRAIKENQRMLGGVAGGRFVKGPSQMVGFNGGAAKRSSGGPSPYTSHGGR